MATHLSCPHCRAVLLLPEGCEGQTTRCPECGDNFVIPGSRQEAVVAPVRVESAKAENPVSEAERQRTKEAFERLTAETVGLEVELARREKARRRTALKLAWAERFQRGRAKLDETVGRAGGFFVCQALGAAAAMLLVSIFSPSAFTYFAAAVLGLAAAGTAYLPFSFVPDDAQLGRLIPRLRESAAEAACQHDVLAAETAGQRQKLAKAEAEYNRVKSALDSRMAWLRSCQWQEMNRANFVNFLKLVFEEHGYQIEPTGKKGQVGIDLVVVRDQARVAVVVTGAQMGTVEKRIVEQADAGKKWYRCGTAAVIANTQFLPSARQLAERTGCTLIDANQIPDLIEGRISI